jgi:hypothetical protein
LASSFMPIWILADWRTQTQLPRILSIYEKLLHTKVSMPKHQWYIIFFTFNTFYFLINLYFTSNKFLCLNHFAYSCHPATIINN